jgi:hypothetical protein
MAHYEDLTPCFLWGVQRRGLQKKIHIYDEIGIIRIKYDNFLIAGVISLVIQERFEGNTDCFAIT